ncbi:MAG: hypothetical protein ABR920_00390 [Terriglobales bacterium]
MAEQFIFEPNCKFAILAINGARADVPVNLILQDGTRVLNSFPFELDKHWKDALGTLQLNNLQTGNLFLVRTATEGWPKGHLQISGGPVDEELQSHIGRVFIMLRLLGTIVYENAFMLGGHVVNGEPECRYFTTTEHFYLTLGCLPLMIREKDLRIAVELHETYLRLRKTYTNTERWRFSRGLYALKAAFEQCNAYDRLPGFVRAIEALILPGIGKTKKQFISRCSLFAGPKSKVAEIKEILQEAYDMRCDNEHMHDWDRSLNKYPVTEREAIALWRTRQMEELASTAYRKILSDKALQPNFHDDATIESFWRKPDDEIRAAFGNCDISELKIVKYYSNGWAHPSEWPQETLESFLRKVKSA